MVLLWLRVAAVLYAAASVAVFPAVLYGRVRWRKICTHLAGLGLFFHFVSAVEMLVLAHRWMPVGVREVESLLGLAVAALFFLVWWFFDAVSLGIFALPMVFFLILAPALGPDRYTFPSEGVRVGWLMAHIAALLIAYAALGFSMLASVLYLAQEHRLKSKPKFIAQTAAGPAIADRVSWWATPYFQLCDWLPPLDTLERIAHGTLELGFPCMTVGLVIGSVLVQETTLGTAYFRDPKIVATFISWGIYVLLLLVRRGAGLRGRKAAYLTGTLFLVMIGVWATNLLSHVHRYGAQ
jgi:ABC-type uncharacterized transport system permease subunit